ncbi:putative quinone oxidoreductase [Sodiomyces alkalinus F11]|uniref:Putative quinone oxidoreductase n=1 Tax=Sodiomyces alkalinus (strain CBS 110278 / VKM F-3762 / F11) TaxID=1314773 RepID=A0A3N2PRG4_SODAK|nr:putative quinone oxidoreductase [Sodiomyces alkalinus F11]ROT37085.1 putative quinone oxidoreductase [Sodiomyces alkalinus F11]
MKVAIVHPDTSVVVTDCPVPIPGPDQVLIKVAVAGTNPKDWKLPWWQNKPDNSGDDVAGTVESVGDGVVGFAQGDRVAAFHVMLTPAGAFAEYALAPSHTVMHMPASVSFEEAATLPLAAYTAAVALFHQLEFPSPWDAASAARDDDGTPGRPLVVYGASTAIGAYAIKLALRANIHPVIAVGSKNSAFVASMLEAARGDVLVDYTAHATPESLVEAIRAAAGPDGARDVFDAVSEQGTFVTLSRAIAGPPDDRGRKPRVTVVLPGSDYSAADPSVDVVVTSVGLVHKPEEKERLFGAVWGRVFERGLQAGWLEPHPHEVAPGGLNGLEGALKALREGKVRGKKMVVRIGETEGVGQ